MFNVLVSSTKQTDKQYTKVEKVWLKINVGESHLVLLCTCEEETIFCCSLYVMLCWFTRGLRTLI